MKLPVIISVPHAGLEIPSEVGDNCLLAHDEIVADGDFGASEIYDISDVVDGFVTTNIARAFVDCNRAPADIRKDGVVKTHTCWDVPIYDRPLDADSAQTLIARYHRPYHDSLTSLSGSDFLVGIDCHTMADKAPPSGAEPGQKRPSICLSDGDGSCPWDWFVALARALEKTFERPVSLNDPFKGGYITRSHGSEMPWIQLEHSRDPYMSLDQKRDRTLAALDIFCRDIM